MAPKPVPKPTAKPAAPKAPVVPLKKAAVPAKEIATKKASQKQDVEEAAPADALTQATAFGNAASAQAAVYGAQATEAVQGLFGGLNDWLGTAQTKPKEKKPVTAPLKIQPEPPIKLPPPKAATTIMKKTSAPKVVMNAKKTAPPAEKVDVVETILKQPGPPPPPKDPNASPRQRPPGKPPVSSVKELRGETDVPAERDDEIMILKSELIVKSNPPTPLMPFLVPRKPQTRLHPSVTPRSEGLRSEETALISDLVDDPLRMKELSGVDKIIQSRQFIDAMRKSLALSKQEVKVHAKVNRSPMPSLVGDRPISPVHDNITTVAFLPLPYDMCRNCGFYKQACVCSSRRNHSPLQKLRRGLQRVVDKIDSPASVPSDDGNGLEFFPERIYRSTGAALRGDED